MDWDTWRPTYEAICAQFGYDPTADRDAARLLRRSVREPLALGAAMGPLRGRFVTVVGCGPSLGRLGADALRAPIVAADGATLRLMELDVVPDVVVTDLDGDPRGLAWARDGGAAMVVHAHGDNRHALETWGAKGGRLCGTYQSAPEPELAPFRNIGGFTDGDRAVALCHEAGAAGAVLAAWEPAAGPGPYSHRYDPATKAQKLAWAQRIVDRLASGGFPVQYAPAG